MKFITKKDSETGLKITELLKRMEEVNAKANEFTTKFGVTQYCESRVDVFGGVEILVFDSVPNLKIWKKSKEVKNGYTPRLTSKEGFEIQADMYDLPVITTNEVNECVGYKGTPFQRIGLNWSHEEYYSFTIQDEWIYEVPKDCEEITTTRYKELFNIK